MALSTSRLATAIENRIRTWKGLGATPIPDLSTYCQIVAEEVINEIKNNATITGLTASGSTGTASAPVTSGVAAVPALSITNIPVSGGGIT